MGAIEQRTFNVTVTSKGQMTIPADVREALGILAGDRLELALAGNGKIEMVKKTRSYKDVIGILSHLAKNRVVPMEDEIDFAIDEAMREQDERSKSGFGADEK